MKNTLLFISTFVTIFASTLLIAEQIMAPYENTAVMSESYGMSSDVCGITKSKIELDGWVPVAELRGPAAPIATASTTQRLTQPTIQRFVYPYCNGCHIHRYTNGCCGNYYQRPIMDGCYRHWHYSAGQPLRNVVRFFHNRRPFRSAIGRLFGFRRCR